MGIIKVKLLVLFLCLSVFSTAQTNLIPNPSFEFTTGCPYFSGDWAKCVSWNNVNMNPGPGSWGTPDYFHTCGTGGAAPPATFAGTCTPKTGNAMISLVLYNNGYANAREYFAAPLTCTMVPGNTYTLSFWITNGTGIKSPWSIKNIGAMFSIGPLSQTGWALISATPQCEITSNVASTSWVQYTFTVNPTAAWNYITLGCFRADGNNNVTLAWTNPGGPASAYANYFFDDISLMAPVTGTSVVINSNPPTGSLCAGQSLTLTASGASSYTWNTGTISSSIVITPSQSATYSVISNGSGCSLGSTAQFSISPLPVPALTVGSLNPICAGVSTTLLVSGAQSYLWNTGASTSTLFVAPTVSTTYTVTGIGSNGCQTIHPIMVTVSPTPTVTISNNTLICLGKPLQLVASGAQLYQWSNGSISPTIIITPTASTVYWVSGTTAAGCKSTIYKMITPVECVGLRENFNVPLQVTIMPNPFANELFLDFADPGSGPVSVRIYNSCGEEVYSLMVNREEFGTMGNGSLSLNPSLPNGIYLLEIEANDSLKRQRIVRQQ